MRRWLGDRRDVLFIDGICSTCARQRATLRSLGDERVREIVEAYIEAWAQRDATSTPSPLCVWKTLSSRWRRGRAGEAARRSLVSRPSHALFSGSSFALGLEEAGECLSSCVPMTDLELERTSGQRRLYAIDGLGTLCFEGLSSRKASALSGDASLGFARRGFWGRRIDATDASGARVGSFEPGAARRGGKLRWASRELTLRPSSAWRERYALADGDDELAVLDGKGWGRRPVAIRLENPEAVDAGLVLFAAFVVRGLADDASAAAAAAASTAATG